MSTRTKILTLTCSLVLALSAGCGAEDGSGWSTHDQKSGKADKVAAPTCADLGGQCAALTASGPTCAAGLVPASESHGCDAAIVPGASTTCCLPGAGPITLTAADSGSSLQVQPGDTIVVELAGNPTTGYEWRHTAGNLPPKSAEYIAGQPVLVGSGGTYRFTFEVPASVGDATFSVELGYYREWMGPSSAIDVFELELVVPGSGAAHTLTKADNGKTLQVQAGDTVAIELAGNPTTGYEWKLTAGTLPLKSSDYTPDQPALVGSGGTYRFTFEVPVGAASGAIYNMQLDYYRSWLGPSSSIETFKATLVVQ